MSDPQITGDFVEQPDGSFVEKYKIHATDTFTFVDSTHVENTP